MQVEDHDADDGQRVWMSRDELAALFGSYSGGADALDDNLEKELALRLMGQCGLRTAEMLTVTPGDITMAEIEEGQLTKLRVSDGKTGDRETVIPPRLADQLRTYQRAYGVADDDLFIDRNRRTIQRWVARAGDHAASVTEESAYSKVTPHDLRRSWAMVLLDSGTGPTVVMELGGWENYRTFKDHYLGHHSDATIHAEVSGAFG
ncbi:site-specific integrase [Halococcus sp. IIIV-5B]|uniref:tyrosine-type recombinase/integrase n=1 Tax=Halococcus sp. IIIV-5B TaxID=2321230 RepID=UPI000E75C18C|nr:site-specific integrase [Halococcus sp. IIIV-5B]RJT06554.1 site-specific integrase [Halococcus sp. IIIV-5B]